MSALEGIATRTGIDADFPRMLDLPSKAELPTGDTDLYDL